MNTRLAVLAIPLFVYFQLSIPINILIAPTEGAWDQSIEKKLTEYIKKAALPENVKVTIIKPVADDGTTELNLPPDIDIIIQTFFFSGRFGGQAPTKQSDAIVRFPRKALIGLTQIEDPTLGEAHGTKPDSYALSYSKGKGIHINYCDEKELKAWLRGQIEAIKHPERQTPEDRRKKMLADATYHLEGLKQALHNLIEDMKTW